MEFTLWSGLLGAPKMELKLDEKGRGTAHITQALSPPVNFTVPVISKSFNITKTVTGFYVTGDQAQPGGPCCGATVIPSLDTRPDEPGTATFWWVDAVGLHDAGLVPARRLRVAAAVGA